MVAIASFGLRVALYIKNGQEHLPEIRLSKAVCVGLEVVASLTNLLKAHVPCRDRICAGNFVRHFFLLGAKRKT